MTYHPFESIFNHALKQSLLRGKHENLVLEEARKLHEGGYEVVEIYRALKHLHSTLLQDGEIALVREALEEFESYQVDE